jgi:hypothetical protein
MARAVLGVSLETMTGFTDIDHAEAAQSRAMS